MNVINKAIIDYCNKEEIEFHNNYVFKKEGKLFRGKMFKIFNG